MNSSDSKYPLLSNTIESFKTLVGYNLGTCRVVFEYEGDEIVFINDSWIGRVRIYLNGRLAYSGWDYTGMIYSSGEFLHKDKTYKIKCVVTNLLTFGQNVTLSVNSDLIENKAEAMFGKLSLKEIGHFMFGAAFVGALLVGLLKMFGL